MLRSAFRGKHPGSTAKDENDERVYGKSSFYSHRELGAGNDDENKCALQQVLNVDSEDLDFQEFYETSKGGSSNEEENARAKFSSAGSIRRRSNERGAVDHEGKDQKGGFSSSERQIYEMQLAQLQEQLVTTMIDHQEMSCRLKKLQTVDVEKLERDLQKLEEENRELKEKLKRQRKVSSSKLQRKHATRFDPRIQTHGGVTEHALDRGAEDWVDLGREQDNHVPSATWYSDGEHLAAAHQVQDDSCQVDGATPEFPGGEPVGGGESGGKNRVQDLKAKVENWKNKAVEVIVDRLWDFVNDEPEFIAEDEGEGEPLSVKRLKENINRFSAGIKPITSFIQYVGGVLSWSNPTASFLIFVVCMYSVWCGNLLSLLLFIAIWKLFYNYLHARGIAKQLGFAENIQEETNTSDDKTWSDKFHLVLQVARKVQNTLGKMADSLEKVKSLLTWQHPEATRKLFTGLCLFCLASLVLRGPTLFRLAGLMLGIKLFIVKTIYRRFPKVKHRYDRTSRLWEELPTDTQLAERESTATNQDTLQRASSASSLPSTSGIPPESPTSPLSSNHFSERFRLPSCQTPLPEWEDGKRCVLMDKDKPLSNFKHGRLHLTQSYLCFEKFRSSNGKNIVIKLENVTKISKAKPIGLMPGTGMAIELHVRGVEKPYVFGGIMGRDEVFENIMATARAGNIAWALT